MKKRIRFIVLFLLLSNIQSIAQIPDWEWAKRAGEKNDDYAHSLITDKDGNIYVSGTFSDDSIRFDGITLYATGGSMFILKYNSTGQLIWAKTASGNAYGDGITIATDKMGNVYVAGNYYGSAISFGNITLNNSGYIDIFLVKYDSQGNVLWAKSGNGEEYDLVYGMTTDASGNVYLTGTFLSSSINFSGLPINNASGSDVSRDMFIVKYNTNGIPVWGKRAGCFENGSDGNSVTIDKAGDIYVTGDFVGGCVTFGTFTFYNTGYLGEFFLVKYNAAGDVLWAKNAEGNNPDGGDGITTDAIGDVYVTGSFESDNIKFGSITLFNAGGSVDFPSDIFIVKYDRSGNVIWAKSAGGKDFDTGSGIITDTNGTVYVTGVFSSDSIIFDGFVLHNTSAGTSDIFICKYDFSGKVIWAKSAGGPNWDGTYGGGNSIASDANNNIYITGGFSSPSVTFGNTTLMNAGSAINGNYNSDYFIAKLNSSTPLPLHWGIFTAEKNIKTVLLKWETLQEQNTDKFIIERSAEGSHFFAIGSAIAKGNSNTSSNYQFIDVMPLPGINIYRLKQTDRDGKYTYSPIRHVNFIETNNIINISPNPVTNLLRIETSSGEALAGHSVTAAIQIYSSTMQLMQSIKITRADGNTVTVPVDRLAKGVYFLQLVTGDSISAVKFVKE